MQDVEIAIRQTLELIGIRIWGGHVLVYDGDVSKYPMTSPLLYPPTSLITYRPTTDFNGCVFVDIEILTPLSDRIYFGGDVLVRT